MGGFQQARGQAGEQLARPLAAGGGDAAVVPGADGGGDLGRVVEAHAFERTQGLRIVVDTGENQAAEGGRQVLVLGEQGGVAGVDAAQHLTHRPVEPLQLGHPRQGELRGVIVALIHNDQFQVHAVAGQD